MRYDRTVLAYHGCDEAVARRLLSGEPFKKSRNTYDWLGEGVYFWEYGHARALQFAREQQGRGKVEAPAVVGALLQLGRCFDLLDTRFTGELRRAFEWFRDVETSQGKELPVNQGATPDRLLRKRDCAVINFYLKLLGERGEHYDSVRCSFAEGQPAYEGSGIFQKSHIQVAIRNPACILGVFRPSCEDDRPAGSRRAWHR
jgi:hypothetical protein